jgi:multidrug efflux pump subunit AcrA (membrane-fusion protein)
MKHLVWILLAAMLVACSDEKQKAAEQMLQKASLQFEQRQYDRALITIDSLRKVYPGAIETRKQALILQQNIELKRSQEELAIVDSLLQVVKSDYETLKLKVEKDKQELRATPEELTMLTKTRVRRDSLQTRFEVLCAKIRYIHKKQKEL